MHERLVYKKNRKIHQVFANKLGIAYVIWKSGAKNQMANADSRNIINNTQ